MSLPLDYPVASVGDQVPTCEAWRIDGFDDTNTDRGRLHITKTVVSGQLKVDLYRTRDKGAADLMLSGQGAVGSRAVLLEQNGSGLSGSVMILQAEAGSQVLFLALATDKDFELYDDRVRGLLGEDPAWDDFSDIWGATMREFLIRIQADYPPPQFVGDPLDFPGTAPAQAQGRRGMPDYHAIYFWHLSGEGNWELVGLQNVGDFRIWATLWGLHRIWDRRARDGQDGLAQRADRYLEDAGRAWKMVPKLVDGDGDQAPEKQVRTRSIYLSRG